MGDEGSLPHDETVRFVKDEFVEFPVGDRTWSFERCTDGTYAAFGPCPGCQGDADGPKLVDVRSRASVPVAVEEAVDVVCECHCGVDHGAGADVGCGRWWVASNSGYLA